MPNVKIAIVAAEIAPHAKVGGLADVIGALPSALKNQGAQPALIVPGYQAILDKVAAQPVAEGWTVKVGSGEERFSVLRASDPYGVPMYLIDHRGFFRRGGIYGEKGADYPDNVR
ncbi:MAG TPA: glycogen/starch synthase, partial [Candidatus Binataceae bacterium]